VWAPPNRTVSLPSLSRRAHWYNVLSGTPKQLDDCSTARQILAGLSRRRSVVATRDEPEPAVGWCSPPQQQSWLGRIHAPRLPNRGLGREVQAQSFDIRRNVLLRRHQGGDPYFTIRMRGQPDGAATFQRGQLT
jgi:hypothetical protein